MTRPLRAQLSRSALQHNNALLKSHAPDARVFAVVKANAYGHGIEFAAKALRDADGFATLEIDSAIKLIFKDVDFFQQNTLLESAIKGNVAKWATSNYLKQEKTGEQAAALGQAQLSTGSWRNAFISFDKLAQVKAEDIARVAQKYYRNFNWVVVGDTRDVDRKLLESR